MLHCALRFFVKNSIYEKGHVSMSNICHNWHILGDSCNCPSVFWSIALWDSIIIQCQRVNNFLCFDAYRLLLNQKRLLYYATAAVDQCTALLICHSVTVQITFSYMYVISFWVWLHEIAHYLAWTIFIADVVFVFDWFAM